MSKHLTRSHAQALLDRGAPTTSGDEPLAAFFDAMRAEFAASPAPEPRPGLVARLDGHRPLRAVPDPLASSVAPRRPVRMLRPAAAACSAGVVLVGGLAAAGALPAPVQRTTADLGRHVGLDLPTPSDAPAPHTRVDGKVHGSTGGASGSGHARVNVSPSGASGRVGVTGATGPSGATGVTVTVPPETLPGLPGLPDLTGPTSVPLPAPTGSAGSSPRVPLPAGLGHGALRRAAPDVPHLLRNP